MPVRSKEHFILLGLIIVVGLTVRILLLKFCYPTWFHGMTMQGEAENIMHGFGYSLDISRGGGMTEKIPSVYDMPGYAYLLAFVWKVAGNTQLIYVQYIQIVVDALFCTLLIFTIAKRYVEEKIAFLSAFLYSVYSPMAYFAVNLGREIWGVLGLLLCFFFFIRYLESQKIYWALLSSFVIGLACYFRPIFVFLPIFLVVASIFNGIKFRRALIIIIAMMGIVYLTLLPWGLRNYCLFDKFIFTRYSLYQNLWVGFGQFPNPVGARYSEEKTFIQMKSKGYPGLSNSTIDYEEFVKPLVIETIRNHPMWYASTVLRRIPMALIINRIPWGIQQINQLAFYQTYDPKNSNHNLWNYVKYIAVANPGFLVTKIYDVFILGLAITGIFLRKRFWRRDLLLLSVLVYLIAVHIPIAVEGRYILPGHWVYLLFISHALYSLSLRLKTYFV